MVGIMLFAKLNDLSIGGKGSYGIAASAVERKADLPTYLRITDIFDDGTLNLSELKSVDAPNSDKYILKPNDIVFARTGGSTGRNYFYDGSDGVFVYAGFLIKFSIDPEKVNPKYVRKDWLTEYYVILAMNDFLKGMRWLKRINAERYHRKLQRARSSKLKNAVCWRVVTLKFRIKKFIKAKIV